MKKVKIFAHRGASAYAPENTMAAFELAMKQGADGIELDVQLTKDGIPVVIHDERIDRVSKRKGAVREFTFQELQKIPVPNGMSQYGEACVPTLEEVLELVKPSAMEVNIELKTGIFWYPDLEKKVLDLVEKTRMEERVIYSSFNHYSIQRVLREKPDANTAYLFSDVIVKVQEYARANGVKGLHPGLHHIEMGFLQEYLDSGLSVRVWTVDRPEQIKRLIKAGTDAVITNVPDLALKVRKEIEDQLSLENTLI